MIYQNRTEAGRKLAAELKFLVGQDVVVLGLPRGGVSVASEVASALNLPLDVIVVRKLGVPFQPELAMGAVSEDGVCVLNPEILAATKVSRAELAQVKARELAEVERRSQLFRSGGSALSLKNRIALIIDDGIATGSTALAACKVARALGAVKVLLAVPVVAKDSLDLFQDDADQVIYLQAPQNLFAVGEWYEDFSAVSEEEVIALLKAANRATPTAGFAGEVEVGIGSLLLPGNLTVPAHAKAIIIFAHGSGSSRLSPRNTAVARWLNQAGFATLLFDLLTHKEESDRANVFDIPLLGKRLVDATEWVERQAILRELPIGYFGASTGAAAALWAATEPRTEIFAIVARGGRVDMAKPRIQRVQTPTLLIVGEADEVVLEMNRTTQAEMVCENQLVVVAGATHLFEEPGALEKVSDLAKNWFLKCLPNFSDHGQSVKPSRHLL
jgi:putative phosphoribosyl transferase